MTRALYFDLGSPLPPIVRPQAWPGQYRGVMRASLIAEEPGASKEFARAASRMAFTERRDERQRLAR